MRFRSGSGDQAHVTETLTVPPQPRPRVWLVAGGREPDPEFDALPVVRDGLMHVWYPGEPGWMHTADGRHHMTWTELRSRYDLEEILLDRNERDPERRLAAAHELVPAASPLAGVHAA